MEIIGKQLKEFEEINKQLEDKDIFSNERLFKCILGLNKTESQVLSYILTTKNAIISDIAEKLNMDRSSIQRAVQELVELKLIIRTSISMKEYVQLKEIDNQNTQGYLYVYNGKDMKSIKIQFKKLLDKWYNAMLNYIENLDNICECCGIRFNPC